MTNKEAIMILESVQPLCEKYSYSESEMYEAIDMAISALAEPHWILCSERLPEEKQDVLLLMPQNMVVGFWEDVLSDGDKVWYANSGNGYFTDMCFIDEYDAPIAWMPLPTYEEVKK